MPITVFFDRLAEITANQAVAETFLNQLEHLLGVLVRPPIAGLAAELLAYRLPLIQRLCGRIE
jgi:hypothetical protein